MDVKLLFAENTQFCNANRNKIKIKMILTSYNKAKC